MLLKRKNKELLVRLNQRMLLTYHNVNFSRLTRASKYCGIHKKCLPLWNNHGYWLPHWIADFIPCHLHCLHVLEKCEYDILLSEYCCKYKKKHIYLIKIFHGAIKAKEKQYLSIICNSISNSTIIFKAACVSSSNDICVIQNCRNKY